MKKSISHRIIDGFLERRLAVIFFFFQLFIPQLIQAQNTEQMWLEYKPTYTFPKDYKLAMRGSNKTNFVDRRWRTFELRLMPEKKPNKHVDIVASLSFLESLEALSSSEIRPAVGGRWHFLPGRRVESGVVARVEFRNVYKQEAQEWTNTTRPRLRIFVSMPLNENIGLFTGAIVMSFGYKLFEGWLNSDAHTNRV